MDRMSLCGKWSVSGGGFSDVEAVVPGCIHTDLLNAKLICDPFYRDNENLLMWIGETEWEYKRNFSLEKELFERQNIILRFEGLDTSAVIYLNGKELAHTDNMFRCWEFDVRSFVNPGENCISIRFEPTAGYVKEKNEKRRFWNTGMGLHTLGASNWTRKMQCNFGWDWGPACITCGIWKKVEILAFDSVRLDDVLITQQHENGRVDITAEICLKNIKGSPLHADKSVYMRAELKYDGKSTAYNEIRPDSLNNQDKMQAKIKLSVDNPKLWWPNNMGEQNLYELTVEIMDEDGVQDTWQKKIGLRTLRLDRHQDKWGETFQFTVNGVPFFAKGANWIPADTFVTRTTDKFYEELIKSAVCSNMNFLRVWGGGIYENDVFYELCDRYGICVWQDFMFACAAYPAFDRDFMENVRQEAIDNVKRLRHHACIALWCGNNEIEQISPCINDDGSDGAMSWEEYEELFDVLLPEVVKEYAPNQDYWPSSPHTPGDRSQRKDVNNPTAGDAHLWTVWHGRQPFEWYRTCEHRFNSEFGFQSFPQPDIVNEYTLPEDRNISSFIMEHHQRSPIGNDAIVQYMLSWFRLPGDFGMQMWLSQILQGMAMKYAVEHWRRKMPQGMGTIYWQLNDCWPGPTWSSIDYKGNWKALHYMAKGFYSPVLLSGVEDIVSNTVEIHLTNDLLEKVNGTVIWKLVSVEDGIVAEDHFEAGIDANSTMLLKVIDLKEAVNAAGNKNVVLEMELVSLDGTVMSSNLVNFVRPKHLELKSPCFETTVEELDSQTFKVGIKAQKLALWVWPDLNGVMADYSDRFFHMISRSNKEIIIKTHRKIEKDEFMAKLRVYSLHDTY